MPGLGSGGGGGRKFVAPRRTGASRAARGIERRAFRVIEFEYHGKGRWLTTSLNATVAALLRHDYTCFWQGNRGRLSRFRPACNYEFRAWSNLVCAHEARIVAVLRALEAR